MFRSWGAVRRGGREGFGEADGLIITELFSNSREY